MRRALVLATGFGLVFGAACGGDGDPCDGAVDACLTLHVSSKDTARVDQLELDLLYGGRHGTTTTRPDAGGTVDLPLEVAVHFPISAPIDVGVVAAGKLAGVVLGTAAATASQLQREQHVELALVLAPPDTCSAGAFYCGGDRIAGDPQTLYQCNAGGVPLARGVCVFDCRVRPASDDLCRGEGGCFGGGYYCGGDKLDGDPQTLYQCSAGIGIAPHVCPDGCVIAAAGADDHCR